MPYRRQQTPFQRAMQGMFSSLSQTIPQYVGYKMEQKAEQQKRKEKEKEWKQKEQKMKLDFYTAMTKNPDPMVAGMAVGKIEELLGTMPYSAVVGQEKLRPRGMPSLGMQAPGRMPMGPRVGGMTMRQPSLGEIVSGAPREVEEVDRGTWSQRESIRIRNEQLRMTREKGQRAADMNLINNYNAKDEQGNFTMSPEVAKMIEAQVKEASMRQFGKFIPRVMETGRKGFLGAKLKDIEKYGTMQTERIKVQSPDGATGTIPANQLEEALRSGYKRVK